MAKTPVTNDFSRVFFIRNGAGPSNAPSYEGFWRGGAVAWPQGDVTAIQIPNPDVYGEFVTVGKIPGEKGRPSISISSYYTEDVSELLKLARHGCDNDLHIHIGGPCDNPRSFNEGWMKALILEGARMTDYGTDDVGALSSGDRAAVTETVPFSGDDLYEVKRLTLAEQAGAQAVTELMDVIVCDQPTCGACGLASDGCNIVFVVAKSSGASPGFPSEVLFTSNGGSTWGDSDITTLGATENPLGVICVGTNLIVISTDSLSLHYADITDILNGIATWSEVATGFVGGGGARKASSAGPTLTWFVGVGGYIYFTDDPTGGVTVQSAGGATVQDLNDVHALDADVVVAVGNSNAVVYTKNGGSTWASVTGPAVGINLNAVWAKNENEWFVGAANGRLYYTRDAGVNWTEKGFAGAGAGSVRAIRFSTKNVGYMAHSTAAPAGRIFRTIDGGFSWYVLPEGAGAIPANDYIGRLGICADPNTIYGVGLGDNASDGILVKGA